MMRHGWLFLVLPVAVAALGGCSVTGLERSASAGYGAPAGEAEPGETELRVWKPSKSVKVILTPSERESQPGGIQWIGTEGSTLLRTWSITRFFGRPCLLGSYPDQLVVLPYLVGGGTGAAEYDWVVISRLDGKPALREMGLWRYWSVSKDSYEFRLSPALAAVGAEVRQTAIEFLYVARHEGEADIIEGTLLLCCPNAEGASWRLCPLRLEDALSCVALLDCRLDAARHWASGILAVMAPDETAAHLETEPNSSEKVERAQALRRALTRWYAEKDLRARSGRRGP